MRQCPRLNSENKQLMDEILRQAVAIFPATESCLPFIGAILYLNKMGAELVDKKSGSMLVNRASELDDLLSHDPLHDVVLSVFENINVSAKDEEELRFLLLSVDMAAFHNGEQLYWYDYAIENASRYKRHDNLSMMPNELATLVLAFVGADAKKVLVPFGGTMNCVMKFDSFESIDSFELSHQAWQIGMFRMALAGMVSKVHFSNMNVDCWPTNRYDTVISMPPMGMRIKMSTQSAFFESHSMEYTDLIAPCRFLESTNEDGICVAFAPISLLNDESVKKRFRKWAMAEKIIDTVILLPSNLLYDTAIPLSCVILRKKPCHGEAIRMIDATEMLSLIHI